MYTDICACICIYIYIYIYIHIHKYTHALVEIRESLLTTHSSSRGAKKPYKRDCTLQKRPTILSHLTTHWTILNDYRVYNNYRDDF